MYQHKFVKLLLWLGILMVFVTGCGKKDSEDTVLLAESASKTYTISSRLLKPDIGSVRINRNYHVAGEMLYFLGDGEKERGIYSMPLDRDGEVTRLPIDWDISEACLLFTIPTDGQLYCFFEEKEGQYSLRSYTLQGEMIRQQDIASGLGQNPEEFPFQKAVVDGTGKVYILGEERLRLFQQDGGYCGSIELPGKELLDMVCAGDDTVYVTYRRTEDTHVYLAKVEQKTGKLGEAVSILGTGKLYTDEEGNILTCDARYLYEIDTVTGEEIALLDLPRHYIKVADICELRRSNSGEFSFLLKAVRGNGDELEWITLRENIMAGNQGKEEKTILRLVAPCTEGEDTDLLNFIMEFNKQNENYQVSYDPLGLATDEEFAMFVNTRMISDNCPDLLLVNYFLYETYAEAGVLEDLQPYMEQSLLISTQDYLDNAIAPYKKGDAIYGFPKTLDVQGWVGKKSQVEELYQNMTIDSFLSFLEKHPSARFEYDGGYSGLLRTCLKFGMGEYVDFEKGVCSFDGQKFRELMERIKATQNIHAVPRGQWNSVKESDAILFMETHLIDFLTLEKDTAEYGEELIFLGYPSEDGSLVGEAWPEGSLAIAANSKEKEGAWEFLKYYILNYHSPYGMPAEKYRFEEQWKSIQTPKYEADASGQKVEAPISYFFYQNQMEPIYALSEERANHIYEAVKSARPFTAEEKTILNIVYEESSGYFYGQKTLKETVDVIQNRCQLFLDERGN